MRSILFLILFVVPFFSANGQNRWKYVSETDDADGLNYFYYDSETARYSDDKKQIFVWIKIEHSNPKFDSYDGKFEEYILQKCIYYCKSYSLKVEESVYYYTDGSTDRYVINNYKSIVPDTIGETILITLCELIGGLE